jgi:hypothetical protein
MEKSEYGVFKIVYKYDSKNNLISQSFLNSDGSIGKIITNVYNRKNLLTFSTVDDKNRGYSKYTTKYEYDTLNRVVKYSEYQCFSDGDHWESTIKFEFGKDGLLTSETKVINVGAFGSFSEQEAIDYKTEFSYDEMKRQIGLFTKTGQGTITNNMTWKYDSMGNLIQISEDNNTKRFVYKFE